MSDTLDRIRGAIQRRSNLQQAYRNIFGGPDGQRVLAHIMKVGCVTSSTLVAGDPYQTAHNEGKRNLALSILRFICKDNDKILAEIERGIDNDNQ